jgi:pimeloyl-ACP methyl ester carboxylesterase
MKTETFTVAGNILTYDRVGAGSPVLLLHGAFQSRHLWGDLARSLGERHEVIAPDLRGIGGSGSGDSHFDMKTVGAELAELMRGLGHEQYAVVGHDLGGGVGYALAAQHPTRVTRFAFLDMLLPGFGFEDAWIPRPNGQFLWFAALNAVPGVIETLFHGREKDYLEVVLKGGFTVNKAAISDVALSTYAAAYAQPGALTALSGYFQAMWTNAENNQKSAANKLDIPVLAMGGEFSVRDMAAQSMNAVANHVEGVIVPGAGHWLPEENAPFVLEQLQNFLR